MFDESDTRRIVPLDELVAIVAELGPLPGGSAVTFEPGGQLELSSPPAAGIEAACAALERDHDRVAAALRPRGYRLVALGVDPIRTPFRQLHQPRYDAMERFFDADGPDGRRMMSRTAALQVNVDNGAGAECERRWRLAHRVGPALVATFASSPLAEGEPTGWASSRLATWLAIDPSRTSACPGGIDEWIAFALDANVLLVRDDDRMVAVTERLPFSAWITRGGLGRAPTLHDLDYHLTTLFPPVRPRGFLEVRYLDALPAPWWRVAAAVVVALLCDREAGDEAAAACGPIDGRWCEAARSGLADDAIHAAALATLAAARAALGRAGAAPDTVARCDAFTARYLDARRTPGDDVLDAWRRGERLVSPRPEEDRWT